MQFPAKVSTSKTGFLTRQKKGTDKGGAMTTTMIAAKDFEGKDGLTNRNYSSFSNKS
jgi:hypothetical protein